MDPKLSSADVWRWLYLRRKSVRGQAIVITGGGSGIGRALAELFAVNLGAKVAILDIDLGAAQSAVEVIRERNGIAHAWKCDISDKNETQRCAENIFSMFGTVDILICNAAILHFALMHEIVQSELEKCVNVNIIGTINSIRSFLPSMEARNRGHVVAVSSIAGHYGEAYGVAYCSTKFAVCGIMECLQMEALDRNLNGIAFTTVCPYFTRTPMIIKKGIRPTSALLPFMSVNRCAREIVDAILKEKIVVFIPNYVTLIVSIKGLLSKYIRIAGRKYLNCRYEPNFGKFDEHGKITLSRQNDFFHRPKILWKFLLFSTVFTLLVAYFLNPISSDHLAFISNAPLIIYVYCNLTAAILSLYISDRLQFSFSCAFKWFMQATIFGFPSVLVMLYHKQRLKP